MLLLAVLSVLLRGIFALKNDVMLFCGAWRIPEPELEVVVPPPPPPPPLQPAHLQQGHTFEDIDAMFQQQQQQQQQQRQPRVFGLGRARTDEDDSADRHGPDTDEDGPVSPEELARLIQDAERVEARALAAMGGRVPLSQLIQNARQVEERALAAIADRAARAAIADTMMPVAVTVPQAKARMRTRTTAEGPRTTTLSCPLCGSTMTYKRARAGGGFFGCTTWPVCNGSRRPTADP